MIITKMGLRITDRGEVVKGAPLVEPGDDLFWFNRPRLLLFLIHLVLFQVISPFLFLTFFHLHNSLALKISLFVCFHVAECFSTGIFLLEYCKFIYLHQVLFNLCLRLKTSFSFSFFLTSPYFLFQYEFSLDSCFHETTADVAIRLTMG